MLTTTKNPKRYVYPDVDSFARAAAHADADMLGSMRKCLQLTGLMGMHPFTPGSSEYLTCEALLWKRADALGPAV